MSNWLDATAFGDREVLALILLIIREHYMAVGDWPTVDQLRAFLARRGRDAEMGQRTGSMRTRVAIMTVLSLVLVGSCLPVIAQPAPRLRAVIRAFLVQTGYPTGRPGFVVDHLIPICAGGPDVVGNLQWQERAASYRKDVYERQLCAEIRRQGLGRLHPRHE